MSIDPDYRTPRSANRVNCSKTKGQALLEFAIVLPVVLLLALGVIELGRYAYLSILVDSAARAGAAYGAQSHFTAGQPNNITAAANSDFQNNNQPTSALTSVTSTFVCECDNNGTMSTADCTQTNGGCAAGNEVVSLQVTATGTFSPLFGGSLFGFSLLPTQFTVAKSAILRIGV